MIPYGRQNIDREDINSVLKVLKSDFLTQGETVPRFEEIIKKKINSKYAVACNSATSALHIACLAIGLNKDDIAWTSSNSFVASANCAEYCGAQIDFVDIDLKTGNICIDILEHKLNHAKKNRKLPKILIPVHYAGQPTLQNKIWNLSKKFGFKIIEDASHSLGAKFNGIAVGSCKFSDITVFSFHPVKTITSAEGGAATTNSFKYYNDMKKYRIHGVSPKNNFYNNSYCSFEQKKLGYNYRLSDLHAALGLSQIKKIKTFVRKRNKIHNYYLDKFSDSNIETLQINKICKSSHHLFVIRPKTNNKKYSNIKTINFLRNKGIGANCHYFPIHLHKYYRAKGFKIGYLPNTELHSRLSVSIPNFVALKSKQLDYIVKILLKHYNDF